jgi:hypothetical protein
MQALGSGSILCKECRTMLEVDASGQVAIL